MCSECLLMVLNVCVKFHENYSYNRTHISLNDRLYTKSVISGNGRTQECVHISTHWCKTTQFANKNFKQATHGPQSSPEL